jgi:beta-glucanase (GH16 family)
LRRLKSITQTIEFMRILTLPLFFSFLSLPFCFPIEAAKPIGKRATKSLFTNFPNQKGASKKLVWSDEFNTAGSIDTNKWAFNIGTGDAGWGNNELEYYTKNKKNARIEKGHLIIEAVKEKIGGMEYSSARLLTKGKAAWTYGRFEIRAKLTKGVGTWPAIWMLGSNIDQVGWPTCGEIDIMEHVGKSLNEINWSAHSKLYNWPKGTQKTAKAMVDHVTDSFHVYTLDWSKSALQFYVDNQLYLTVPNENKSTDYYPFVAPQFLLLNLAIGGGFGGPTIDNSIFPVRMEVDYVRVYQ